MEPDKGGEMYSGGYTGKVLRVDLTNKTYSEEPLPVETARDFIGGAGFTASTSSTRCPPTATRSARENKLDLRARPLHRHQDPLRQPHGHQRQEPADRRHGRRPHRRPLPRGDEARRLRRHHRRGRRRGAHLAVDQGRQGQLPLRRGALGHAEHATPSRRSRTSCTTRTCASRCIGPAGEKLSRLACIVNERRVVGRRGLGAVMGAKNLKAIALRGEQQPAIADHEKFKAARKRMLDAMKKSPVLYSQFAHEGTSGNVENCTALGIFPSNNWTTTGDEKYAGTIGAGAIAGARRRAHRLRRVPGGLQPDAPRAGGALLRHHDRGPRVRDALLVRRHHRRHGPRRHHRRRPRRRRVRPRHDVGRRHHRLRHGALRARHHHARGHRRHRPALRQPRGRWSS